MGSESRRTDMRAAGPEGRDEGSADRGFDGWRLKTATPILSKFVDENKIRVVGAVYNLHSGRIELLD